MCPKPLLPSPLTKKEQILLFKSRCNILPVIFSAYLSNDHIFLLLRWFPTFLTDIFFASHGFLLCSHCCQILQKEAAAGVFVNVLLPLMQGCLFDNKFLCQQHFLLEMRQGTQLMEMSGSEIVHL